MAVVTEKKKVVGSKYLLLHQSGAVAQTKSLKSAQALQGLTAVINLETMEHLTEDQQWQKIPEGCEEMIDVESECEEEYLDDDSENEYDDISSEEEVSPFEFQRGAKRCFRPQVVWAYCRL